MVNKRLKDKERFEVCSFLRNRNGLGKYPNRETCFAAIKEATGIEVNPQSFKTAVAWLETVPSDWYEVPEGVAHSARFHQRAKKNERVLRALCVKLGEDYDVLAGGETE